MKIGLLFLSISAIAAALILFSCRASTQPNSPEKQAPSAYLGFDLNIFPGKDALPALRKTFSFRQRELLRSQDFGFLLLYLGPLSRELKNEAAAAQKGTRDARNAASVVKSEGFPSQAIIFLDIEEGGRLSVAYHAYLRAWASGLAEAGYRSGAYCSGIPLKEEPGVTITTADDIRAHIPSPDFVYFIFNDVCPPSPGCTYPQNPPSPAVGGILYASVWQYAQSPRRMDRTAHCAPGYHADGNCYAPGDTAHAWSLDVNSATSPDPSNGR
jgi:Rv2525c-like, glycoside hydrolase-like domain